MTIFLALVVEQALACGIEGTVLDTDGHEAAGSISSSVSAITSPVKKGHFWLDLGDAACGVDVTVYLDKKQPAMVKTPVTGNVQVNFVKVKGAG